MRPTGEWLNQPGGLTERLERMRKVAGLTGDRLARELGYVAFALDYWGNGEPLPAADVPAKLGGLMADQATTRRRARAGLDILLAHPRADPAADIEIATGLGADPRIGDGAGADADLRTSADFGRAEFVIDYQPPKSGPTEATIVVRDTPVTLTGGSPGKFSRFLVTVEADRLSVRRDETNAREVALRQEAPAKGPLALRPAVGGGVFMNLHVRDL